MECRRSSAPGFARLGGKWSQVRSSMLSNVAIRPSYVGKNHLVVSVPQSGLPTKPGWAGPTATGREPFPKLLVPISHIDGGTTNSEEPLATDVGDIRAGT